MHFVHVISFRGCDLSDMQYTHLLAPCTLAGIPGTLDLIAHTYQYPPDRDQSVFWQRVHSKLDTPQAHSARQCVAFYPKVRCHTYRQRCRWNLDGIGGVL